MFFFNKNILSKEDYSLDKDKLYIKRYLNESVCKRRVIEEFLDNNIIEQCSNNALSCNLCLNCK